jgi:hypothetical protein
MARPGWANQIVDYDGHSGSETRSFVS